MAHFRIAALCVLYFIVLIAFSIFALEPRWTIPSSALPKTRSVNAMTAPAKVRNQAPRPAVIPKEAAMMHGRCGRQAMDLQLVLFSHDHAGTEKPRPVRTP